MPVYLVGAGPGDPGLITVKGLRCLKMADVVVYDYLAPKSLLLHAPDDCEKVYVGKKGGEQHISQDEINALILRKAREGKTVVRLKGGDPFVFGRGGEEALALAEHGIDFEVVPGVTSGIAAAAYAGIPVTHRGLSSALAFVTAHEDPTKPASAVDWQALARMGTVAFYMGTRNLPHLVAKLVAAGKPPSTPVAVIRWGATASQQTIVGTLRDIAERAKDVAPPALTIVGRVVDLRRQLNWFETKPLFGRTVLVTRTREQASELRERLAEKGARVLELPTIRVVEPSDWQPADQAIEGLESFDWVVFTSPNGVGRFLERLMSRRRDVRPLARAKLAVIGPATQKRLGEFHMQADLAPAEHTSEGLLAALREANVNGKRVLLARAEEVPDLLPKGLAAVGARVTEVAAYRTITPHAWDADVLDELKAGSVDVVTFTSSSTAANFRKCLTQCGIELGQSRPVFASIGPVTTRAAQGIGFEVSIESAEITIPNLVEAIVGYFVRVAGASMERGAGLT